VDYYTEIIEELDSGRIKNAAEFERKKVELCRKYRMQSIPPNSAVLERLPDNLYSRVLPVVRLKPARTVSGIAAVAIMTSPYNCPHGTCIYCPGGVENNSSQAYTGKEPAARRAAMNNFDPFRQAVSRIEQLQAIGHSTNKIDLILMGGTFTARTREYQEWFVKRAFDAMNGINSTNILEAHALNEKAHNRCVGMTVETRPDQLSREQIRFILMLGATRVEIGVQCLFNDILKRINRAHTVEDVMSATSDVRENGLKVGYHMMPGLPGMTWEMEMENFRRLFTDERLRPDMLKIYPTLIIEGTPLHEMYRRGLYEEFTVEKAVRLLAEVKKEIPEYVRIQRIQRDIPAPQIEAGVKKSNLRELIREEMDRMGWKCRCIRCREIGHLGISEKHIDPHAVEMKELEYTAASGIEKFISFEFEDAIVGYLRLRNALDDHTYVRELKVFGRVVPVGSTAQEEWQHRGYGQKLMKRAEEITVSWGKRKIRVTSGVGVRDYYRKLGYELEGYYMSKHL